MWLLFNAILELGFGNNWESFFAVNFNQHHKLMERAKREMVVALKKVFQESVFEIIPSITVAAT